MYPKSSSLFHLQRKLHLSHFTPALTLLHPGSRKWAFAHFCRSYPELLQRRQRWRRSPAGVGRMRAVARQRQSRRRGSNGAGVVCVGSGARGGGARGCSCDRGPEREPPVCSVAAGAEGRESGPGVGSLRGPGVAVPPELRPSTPGRYGPLGEGLPPSASPRPSTSMVVKLAAPGSARHQIASFAPSSSWGASLAPAHGHLRRRLLSPAEPTPGGGRGRGSPCRGCVQQGDDGDRRRVGVSSGTALAWCWGSFLSSGAPGGDQRAAFSCRSF